jgi:hypothetical protein
MEEHDRWFRVTEKRRRVARTAEAGDADPKV